MHVMSSSTPRILTILALVIATSLLFGGVVSSSTGSNTGSYGTQTSPAVVSGQVTNSGVPVANATISTVAGHSTTTDGSGNYTLPLDAPGIHRVTATSGEDTKTSNVDVTLGATSVLDIEFVAGFVAPIPGVSTPLLFVLAVLLVTALIWVLWRRQRPGYTVGLILLMGLGLVLVSGNVSFAGTGPGYSGLSDTERGTVDMPAPGGVAVNTFSGNLTVHRTIFTVSGKGLPVDIRLIHNSDHRLTTTHFGFGWNLSYNIRYTKDAAGNLTIVWGDGRLDTFTESGGSFTAPSGVYMTVTEPVAGQVLLKYKSGIEYHFDATHQKLTTIVDPNGNTLTFTYNAANRLTTVTDAGGRTYTLAYDGSGRLTTVTDVALTRSYTMGYDGSGRLTGITDPLGSSESFAYDAENLITGVTDKRGNAASITYITPAWSASTRLPATTAKGGSTVALAFNNSTDTTTMTDPNGGSILHAYNTNGTVASMTDAATNVSSFVWDGNKNPTSITDREGNTTNTTYDAVGNILTQTDALGQVTTFTYESTFNRVLTVTNRRGNTWTNTYDSAGNLLTNTDPATNTVTNVYDAAGQVTSTTNRNGNTTTFTYNANGNLVTVTDPLTNQTQFVSDGGSRLTQVTDSNNNVTAYAYDALNRLTVVTDALSNADGRTYDANGNLIGYTDRNSNPTTYAYDALNRLTVVTDALSNADGRTYDANSNLTVYTDRRGKNWTSTYDAVNRVVGRTNPLSAAWTYAYDANSNLLTHTDAKTQVTTFTYDALNRLTSQGFADTTSATLTYDDEGNLLTAVDAASSYTYVYDALDRRTTLTDNNLAKSVLYAYDPLGRLTSKTGPESDVVTYVYDISGRMTSLVEGAGTTNFTYDTVGNMLTDIRPNTAQTTFTYDVNNRLAQVVTDAPAPAQLFTYTRDANGWVSKTGRFLSENELNFTRDALGRITQETGGLTTNSTNYVRDYTYDANGNQTRLVNTGTGGSSDTVLVIDDANRPVTRTTVGGSGPTTYAYDANGSRITTTFPGPFVQTWGNDVRNRVVSWDGGGTTVDYTYDVMGRRIRRQTSSGADRKTMFGSDTAIAEDTNGDGTMDTTFTVRPNDDIFEFINVEGDPANAGELGEYVSGFFFPDGDDVAPGQQVWRSPDCSAQGSGLTSFQGCSAQGSAPDRFAYRVDTEMFFPGSPTGQASGGCSAARGITITTGIALSCQGRTIEILSNQVSLGCTTPTSAVSEPSACNWRGDQDSLPSPAISVGQQAMAHSVTKGSETVQLHVGGNRDVWLRTTFATNTSGEDAWSGTTFADGGLRGFDVSATTSLTFDLAGMLFGAREESSNSKILGPVGVWDSQTRTYLTVGGPGGNSTSPGASSKPVLDVSEVAPEGHFWTMFYLIAGGIMVTSK